MKTETRRFNRSARATYTCVKFAFCRQSRFSGVTFDDDLFIVEARHGSYISPFGEKVRVKVVATAPDACDVTVESSSRSVANVINLRENRHNVSDILDYISNEVFKLVGTEELNLNSK